MRGRKSSLVLSVHARMSLIFDRSLHTKTPSMNLGLRFLEFESNPFYFENLFCVTLSWSVTSSFTLNEPYIHHFFKCPITRLDGSKERRARKSWVRERGKEKRERIGNRIGLYQWHSL